MKAKRAYYHRNIGSLNKGAKIELLKVIVSYVLNTVIPVFYLIVWLLRPLLSGTLHRGDYPYHLIINAML